MGKQRRTSYDVLEIVTASHGLLLRDTHSEDDVTELIRLKLPKIKTETKTETKIKTKTETKITLKTKTVDFHVKPIELQ